MIMWQRVLKGLREVGLVFIVAAGLTAVIASGGDSGGSDGDESQDRPAASSVSFSPVTAKGTDGQEVELYWKYRINNGTALQVYEDGMALTFDLNDIVLTINPGTMKRKANINGNISGDASGNFSVDISENLNSLDNATLINSQELDLAISVSSQGESVNIAADLFVQYSSPAEWFLDREDLDELPIGYKYNERGAVYGTLSGDVSISTSGYGDYNDTVYDSVTSAESWEITDKVASITVQGDTYYDVVVVQRETFVPGANFSGHGSLEEAVLTYWVTKGIGMVKGVGQFNFMGNSLEIELVETNLVPGADAAESQDNIVPSETNISISESEISTVTYLQEEPFVGDDILVVPPVDGMEIFPENGGSITEHVKPSCYMVYEDNDEDGFGNPDKSVCIEFDEVAPHGMVSNSWDCDDTTSEIGLECIP